MAISIRYGILIALGLIIYFLTLSLFGVQTNPIYSLGNGIIVGFGLYQSMKVYKLYKGSSYDYQKGFMGGIFTGFNATLIFTVFFAVYVTNINDSFLPEMLSGWDTRYHIGVGTVVFVAAVMGFATTTVLTLSFMQLFKESWNIKHSIPSSSIKA